MAAEANKKTSERFVEIMGQRDWDKLPSVFTSDARWWMNGDPAFVGYAGDESAASRFKDIAGLMSRFDNWSVKIHNIFATDDQVALEWELGGTDRQRPELKYENHISMVHKFRDGKIAVIREYFDTAGPGRYFAALQKPA